MNDSFIHVKAPDHTRHQPVAPCIRHRFAHVDGVRVSYREAGPPDGLPLLLLHGFPSASHQFGRLLDALGTRHRLIAPDYPGFGHTEAPADFVYSFDNLAEVLDGFVRELGLRRFAMYAFDFGGPVGFRLATRDPNRIAGLIVQNANAYHEGLSGTARHFIEQATASEIRDHLLVLPATRGQYEEGAADPALIDPDAWTLDQHFLDLPGRKDAQVALALDYRNNLAQYPRWQAWLREYQPPTLILWGRGDPLFIEPGAHAYRRDLPSAELHLLDAGHFALAERLPEIAPLIADFLDRVSVMRIAVIGATGRLGGAVAREAAARGHEVTPLGSADVDVTDAVSIAKTVAGHDAVVASVKGPDRVVPRGARALLDAAVKRLVFVGGGGSLLAPSGGLFIDSPDFPAAYRQTAVDQAEALNILRHAETSVEWSYLSPPPTNLIDGARTGHYRVEASETPITDEHGDSRIYVGDLAAAAVDALERRSFVGQRFTLGYCVVDLGPTRG